MEKLNTAKTGVTAISGVVGGFIGNMLGGWDFLLTTLLGFMVADYATGFVLAKYYENSPKTEGGGLSSKAGFRGICKKFAMLTLVYMAVRYDVLLGVEWIRYGVLGMFIFNESTSVIENCGLMGLDIPEPLTKGVELLKQKKGE